MKKFDNENRSRYYGLRIGDIVTCEGHTLKQFKGHGEVIDYGWDNNEVLVKCSDKEIKCVAEWMDIVTKVEDK